MSMRIRFLAAVMVTAFGGATGGAQEPAPPAPAARVPVTQPASQVQAKITVVISRHQGDRKLSSLPYVFGVTSGERTNLRMGSEVPIGSKSEGTVVPSPISYRSIGTNIDCGLSHAGPGLYRVLLVVEDSSVHLDRDQKSGNPAVTADFPSFRSFKANFIALLHDGQTMQHTSVTDPVTGEVMRVDLTMNLLK
jgi:hypothetical protein